METSAIEPGSYSIPARRITGTHEEKLGQLDVAIQELLALKVLECAQDQPGVRFLAAPARSHWLGMTVTILMLLLLLLVIGVTHA